LTFERFRLLTALKLDDAIEALRLALALDASAESGSTIDFMEYARA
jgi:hypothetical protein